MTTEIIGIDGPAGSGKSTVARAVARELGWTYLDTGAMYRAVTVGALRAGISLEDGAALGSYASAVTISLFPRVTIDDVDVSDDLRLPTTNEGVSVVASNAQVRECMVEVQRAMADQPRLCATGSREHRGPSQVSCFQVEALEAFAGS